MEKALDGMEENRPSKQVRVYKPRGKEMLEMEVSCHVKSNRHFCITDHDVQKKKKTLIGAFHGHGTLMYARARTVIMMFCRLCKQSKKWLTEVSGKTTIR